MSERGAASEWPSERGAASEWPSGRERPAMRCVLAAVDDSAAALPVIRVAETMARTLGADLRVVHVGEDGGETAAAVARHFGVPIEPLDDAGDGDPARRIAKESNDASVSFVVVGARRHRSGRRPCGHVAMAVMTGASKPVIVVPPDVRLAEAPRFQRVLIPLEGTEESTIGVAAGLEALAAAGVEIVAVHVFHSDTMPRFLDHAGHAEQSWGTEFLTHWCAQPHVDLHLRSGHVSGAILDVAGAEHVDLIVIAWSRTMDHDRAKVVREILSRSDLPVLLTPSER